MNRPRVVHALLLVPLALVAAWLATRATRTREDPAAVLLALRQAEGPLLPAGSPIGAIAHSETERYDRESLYAFIDGAADAYLTRGFECCAAMTYTFPGSLGSTFDVAVEVHRFAGEAGARAQADAEHPAASRPVPGVAGAFSDSSVLVATSGRDFLKITALSSDPAASTALERLAAAWLKEPR
jgi:hypothetical protein